MSFESNRAQYLNLMRAFLLREAEPSEFVAAFHVLWMADCEEDHAQIESWDEPYDELLIDAFHDGKMGVTELASRMRAIRGITDAQARARELLHRAVTACDVYRADDGRMDHEWEEYDLDDSGLAREITEVHRELAAWRDG